MTTRSGETDRGPYRPLCTQVRTNVVALGSLHPDMKTTNYLTWIIFAKQTEETKSFPSSEFSPRSDTQKTSILSLQNHDKKRNIGLIQTNSYHLTSASDPRSNPLARPEDAAVLTVDTCRSGFSSFWGGKAHNSGVWVSASDFVMPWHRQAC